MMISNAATRHFAEIQPATEPSDIDWYMNVINIRQFTLQNIASLCRIKSELPCTGRLYSLLESAIDTDSFYFTNITPVIDKSILSIEFLFDVWIVKFCFICQRGDPAYPWYCEYIWQAFDGERWIDINSKELKTKRYKTDSFLNHDNNDVTVWEFENPTKFEKQKYSKWRIYGKSGKVYNGYISLCFFHLI